MANAAHTKPTPKAPTRTQPVVRRGFLTDFGVSPASPPYAPTTSPRKTSNRPDSAAEAPNTARTTSLCATTRDNGRPMGTGTLGCSRFNHRMENIDRVCQPNSSCSSGILDL